MVGAGRVEFDTLVHKTLFTTTIICSCVEKNLSNCLFSVHKPLFKTLGHCLSYLKSYISILVVLT